MKLYLILFFLISIMPTVAMQGGKRSAETKPTWESGQFPSGDIKWIRYEQNKMIVIIQRPDVDRSTGRRYDADSGLIKELTHQEVMNYLKEIHPSKRVRPKFNPRDL